MIAINARFLTQQLSGVQRYAIELSLRLKKIYRDEIMFLAPKNIISHDIAKSLEARIIGNRTGYLWEQWDLPQWLRQHGSPLLVCLANLAPICYGNKITAIHDVLYTWKHLAVISKVSVAYRVLFPIIMKTSRHLITVSEFSKKDICSKYGIALDKFSVVHCACNIVGEKDVCRMDEDFFFAMGSMGKSKNLRNTLEAFDILSKRRDNVSLYVGGYDSSEENFRRNGLDKYLRNSRIVLKGRLSEPNLVRYYSNAIGLVYPSLGEGFGIPPLEAQNCGCPVIISDVLSLPEIYGESGLFCNPWSPKDIAEKMEMLLEDKKLCEALIEKGKKNAKRFSWDKSAEKLAEIINIYK